MKDRILFCVGEGLGNVIESMPLVKTLYTNRPDIQIDILNLSNCPNEAVAWLFSEYGTLITKINFTEYIGRIELATTKSCLQHSERIDVPLLNNIDSQDIYRPDRNEIEVYLNIAREFKIEITENCFEIDFPEMPKAQEYDIVVHNGCSLRNPKQWQRKKYPYMEELIEFLISKKLRVTSIGSPEEYCGGDRHTGTDIKSTTALINSSKFFISNDTGTYHLAAALKKPGIVLFTATSTIKNYHPTFHRSFRVLTKGLPCQPCQYKSSWDKCTPMNLHNWECREIPKEKIIKELKNAEII